jgi:hypothetical protein
MPKQDDPELLRAALVGLEHQRAEIDRKMAELRGMIGGSTPVGPKAGRRTMSAAAKKRIAAAQKQRWANARAAGKQPKKRLISAEGRRRIAEATRKRWAAFRKAKKSSAA